MITLAVAKCAENGWAPALVLTVFIVAALGFFAFIIWWTNR